MSELQIGWTPEQVQENLGEANESLPEAPTTDRFPPPGTATGTDVRAGEQPYEEPAEAAEPGSKEWLPPDPPRHPDDEGGR